MGWEISFHPLLPMPLIMVCALLAVGTSVLLIFRKQRGWVWRGLMLTALVLVLLNPTITQAEREPLTDVAVIVIDDSNSQAINERRAQARDAQAILQKSLANEADLEIRTIHVRSKGQSGTQLFEALSEAWADVPTTRRAGAVLITDGQVHDALAPNELAEHAPVHALLTGRPGEHDRRIVIEEAPRFGLIGVPLAVTFRVLDEGSSETTAATVPVTLAVDGEVIGTAALVAGETHTLQVDLGHRGTNIITLEADVLSDEVSGLNNRVGIEINGIREALRVLLVSGEPYAGERTWRNLLKADPAVDLVHFTILRPPEKEDGTPVDELSLIAFPTRELFSTKLDEFDLIIFDRYQRRGVLPHVYLDNIAAFVERGGALLAAAGPASAHRSSLARTPLARVLPAHPTGDIAEQGYRPTVTEMGGRHPIVAALPGAQDDNPAWGRWFRHIIAEPLGGEVLLSGVDEAPLLIVEHVGEGRVAQLMSDHSWLWARGYEGGGPQPELLRRLAHWLMREPDLEEERLWGREAQGQLMISRRTLVAQPSPVTVTGPQGAQHEVILEPSAPGLWEAKIDTQIPGLYRLTDGELTAAAAIGGLDNPEYGDLRADPGPLEAVLQATGGGAFWLSPKPGGDVSLPRVRRIPPSRTVSSNKAHGASWLGLRANKQSTVRALSHIPLLPAFLALILTLGALALAWLREGR